MAAKGKTVTDRIPVAGLSVALLLFMPVCAWSDGLLFPPAEYEGSLEEQAQEAMIVFSYSDRMQKATEHVILKVTVNGEIGEFAWVVPFPRQPVVERADSNLFKELYDYVHWRPKPKSGRIKSGKGMGGGLGEESVEVLSREVVGQYDVAVVRENTPGTLNQWLRDEGYREVKGGEDIIEFYRKKAHVFACIKVSDAETKEQDAVDLHPLRFTFTTDGRDGIWYPMKMTGLQSQSFDVNLYVFHRLPLNDRQNEFGYEHRGFRLVYRDQDGPECEPNAGKTWSEPWRDPYLRNRRTGKATIAGTMRDLAPGERFYLTNIQVRDLDPAKVRKWPNDLWLFPDYTDKEMVPYDARPGGPAAPPEERR